MSYPSALAFRYSPFGCAHILEFDVKPAPDKPFLLACPFCGKALKPLTKIAGAACFTPDCFGQNMRPVNMNDAQEIERFNTRDGFRVSRFSTPRTTVASAVDKVAGE